MRAEVGLSESRSGRLDARRVYTTARDAPRENGTLQSRRFVGSVKLLAYRILPATLMKKKSRAQKSVRATKRKKTTTPTVGRVRDVSAAPKPPPMAAGARPDVAFYYPGHLWFRPDWIKTLLLFFDGVALLVPEYKQREPEIIDPVLAGPLLDEGLLHYLIADKVVNRDATERLAAAIEQLMSSGAFKELKTDIDCR